MNRMFGIGIWISVLGCFLALGDENTSPKPPKIQPSEIRLRFPGTLSSIEVKKWVVPGGASIPGNIFIYKVTQSAGGMGMSPMVAVEYGISDCPANTPNQECEWAWSTKSRYPNPKPEGMDFWVQSPWQDNLSTGGFKKTVLISLADPRIGAQDHAAEIRFFYAKGTSLMMPSPQKIDCTVSSVTGDTNDLETTIPPTMGSKITFDLTMQSLDLMRFNSGAEGEPYIRLRKPLKRKLVNDKGRILFSYGTAENVSGGISLRSIAVLDIMESTMAGGGHGGHPGMEMPDFTATLIKSWQLEGTYGSASVAMNCSIQGSSPMPMDGN